MLSNVFLHKFWYLTGLTKQYDFSLGDAPRQLTLCHVSTPQPNLLNKEGTKQQGSGQISAGQLTWDVWFLTVSHSYYFITRPMATWGGRGGQKKGGDPWPWLRRQWRNYAGVKTRMAATRHSSSNQQFLLHPQSHIYINIVYRSFRLLENLAVFLFFTYKTWQLYESWWEAMD